MPDHNGAEITFFPSFPDLSLQMCKPISGQDTQELKKSGTRRSLYGAKQFAFPPLVMPLQVMNSFTNYVSTDILPLRGMERFNFS